MTIEIGMKVLKCGTRETYIIGSRQPVIASSIRSITDRSRHIDEYETAIPQFAGTTRNTLERQLAENRATLSALEEVLRPYGGPRSWRIKGRDSGLTAGTGRSVKPCKKYR